MTARWQLGFTRRIVALVVIFALATLALAGCGGGDGITAPPPPPAPSVAGSWQGSYLDSDVAGMITLTMGLNMSPAGAVDGTGSFNLQTVGLPMTISGTFTPPQVTLLLTFPSLQPIQYVGTMNGNTITGVMNGSGYINQQVTFRR